MGIHGTAIHRPHMILDLPDSVVAGIFGYLGTGDLLSVMLVSRFFAVHSMRQLYHKLVITNNLDIVQEAKLSARDSFHVLNCGTFVHSAKLANVLHLLTENSFIAECVKKLVFVDNWEYYPNSQLIKEYLNGLLQNVLQLDVLVFPPDMNISVSSLSFLTQAPVRFQYLHKLVLTLGENNEFDPIFLPGLKSLKIRYAQSSSPSQFYVLCQSLLLGQSLRGLRHLSFEPFEEKGDIVSIFDNLSLNSLPKPSWLSFFEAVPEESLSLSLLSLDRILLKPGEFDLIQQRVNFNGLQTLKVRFGQLHSHGGVPIPPETIQNLILEGIPRCHECQRIIGEYVNGCVLQTLRITGYIPGFLLKSLSTIQPFLKKLSVFNLETHEQDYILLSKCLNNRICVLNYDKALNSSQLIQKVLFEDSFGYSYVLVNDYMLNLVEENAAQGLSMFLKCYLNIAFSPVVRSDLDLSLHTQLEDLEVMNFRIRVKRDGGKIRLYYWNNKNFLSM